MLRQLPGDTEATGLGKFSHQSPRYRDITSRELASADHPRFGRLRPSAIHSTPTLTQLRKQRKRKSVAVVIDERWAEWASGPRMKIMHSGIITNRASAAFVAM